MFFERASTYTGIVLLTVFLVGKGLAQPKDNHTVGQDTNISKVPALRQALIDSDEKAHGGILLTLRDIYANHGKWDSVYYYNNKLIAFATQYGEYNLQADALCSNFQIRRLTGQGDTMNFKELEAFKALSRQKGLERENAWDVKNNIAAHFANSQRIDSAVWYSQLAIEHLDASDGITYIAGQKQLAFYKLRAGQKVEALETLLEVAYREEQELIPSFGKMQTLELIGDILLEIQDFDKAKVYYKKSLQLARQEKYSKSELKLKAKLGDVSYGANQLDSAQQFWLDVVDKLSGKTKVKYGLKLVNIELKEDNLTKASQEFDLIDKQFLKGDAELQFVYALTEVQLALQKDQYMNALNVLRQIQLEDVRSPEKKANYHYLAYQVNKQLGKLPAALDHFEEYRELNDSIIRSLNYRQVQWMENTFNRDQQDQEIAHLNEMTFEQQKTLQARRSGLIGFGILSMGLFALAIFLYRLLRTNRKQKTRLIDQKTSLEKALEENKVLIKEIHHRVKNNLQVISSLLNIQERKVIDGKTKEALKSSKSRVQAMSILHQNLYRKKDNLRDVNVKNYTRKLIENIFTIYNVNEKIELELDVDAIEMDVEALVSIGLIMNELICNAIKHAFVNQNNPKLIVQILEKDDNYLIRVKDNGIGLSEQELPELKDSMGARLIKSFAQRLEAELRIENERGTTVQILIPKENIEAA